MKSILKLLVVIIVFGLNTAHAYVVYNFMNTSVQLIDSIGSGISMSIPKDGSVACNPKSKGCSGNINFSVYRNYGRWSGNTALCRWTGVLGNDSGNYFVIYPSSSKGLCSIEYYHD